MIEMVSDQTTEVAEIVYDKVSESVMVYLYIFSAIRSVLDKNLKSGELHDCASN